MMSRAKPVSRDTNVKAQTVKMCPIIGRARSPVIVRAPPAGGEPTVLCDAGDSAGEFTGCARFRAWHPEAGNRYLGAERAPHRYDDAVLGRLVEIGVHRQADHLFRQPLAHWRPTLCHRKPPVRLLAVEWDGIVDCGRDALGIDRRCKRSALTCRKPDGVLRPDRSRAPGKLRNDRDIGETVGVSTRGTLARGDLLGKNPQL